MEEPGIGRVGVGLVIGGNLDPGYQTEIPCFFRSRPLLQVRDSGS
jgi:hypothetical protein